MGNAVQTLLMGLILGVGSWTLITVQALTVSYARVDVKVSELAIQMGKVQDQLTGFATRKDLEALDIRIRNLESRK